ncbi:MAG: acriflavine resistance protein [Ramlibacter sp.]|nr:acriflavine resistance protein [Ramlibacter sp.]
MSVSANFIKRPIGTTLLALAILLLGVAAYPLLPVAPLPQVDFPTIQVSASLPGASPETMASNVAQPLERQFSLISGLSQMTSQSGIGSTQVTLQFDLNKSIDSAALDVQAAIQASAGQLPANLPSPPNWRKTNPADAPIMLLAVHSDTLPLTEVDRYAEDILAQQISRVPGVGLVNIGGAQKPSVRIQADPAKLASLGVSLEYVRTVIGSASVNQPKGTIDGPNQAFTVYSNDQLLKAQPWNDVIVAYRNGAPVRVRDIGQAVDGPENVKIAAWSFKGAGAPKEGAVTDGRAIILPIYKEPGANVITTVDAIKQALPGLQASIPPSVQVSTLVDRTQNIRASVRDVEFTLALTIGLVVLVIFLFLRSTAATLIPSVTVPLALLGTAAIMYPLGFSLDNLSLMALTISVGFVVDDAIVMLENIYRHVEDGMPPLEAAYKGAAEIAFTIVSISVSLVAVFIPLLLMGGIVGRLFREFAVTVTLTIFVSVLVSLSLTPMLCSRFLRNEHGKKHGRLYQLCERGFDAMLNGYRRGLDVVMKHQFATLCVFIATMAATAVLYTVIPKGFFPQQDTGFIFGSAQSAQDSSFDSMNKRMVQFADIVRRDPDVTGLAMFGNSSQFNAGNFFIALKPKEEGRSASADEVIARLRPKLAPVEGASLLMQAGQDINVGGRQARTQFQYTLTDPELDELNEWAPKILERLQHLPQLTDVSSDLQNSAATAQVVIDRDRASSFGITPAMIDATIYDAIGQRQVAQYFTQINSYHVVLEVTPALQRDPDLFSKLYITSPLTQHQVPLSTFAKIDTSKTAYLAISHQSQFPAVTLSFNLVPGAALGDAVDAINAATRQMGLPASLHESFQEPPRPSRPRSPPSPT